MRRWIVAFLALAILVLVPFSVFAGSAPNGDITLTYPDDMTTCTPEFKISTTGIDPSWTVKWDLYKADGNKLIPPPIQSGSTTGNLNLTLTPDSLAPGTSQEFGFFVAVSIPGKGKLTKLSGQWMVTCEKEEPTKTPVPPTPTNTPVPPTPTNTPEPPPAGGEGCTPGYWKNHEEVWSDLADDDFDATFGSDVFDPNISMIAATALNGGGLNALARHAAAAYANAASGNVDYDLTTQEVVDMFNAAVPDGDIEGTKDMFEGYNEQGCPL